jgi:hypothetical protein
MVPNRAEGRVELWDGWSIDLPVACMTTRNEDGSWSAWDSARTIDVHIITTAGRRDGSALSAQDMLGAAQTVAGTGWIGAREILLEEGTYRFAIAAAPPNTLMSCWVSSRSADDEQWAAAVMAGIVHESLRPQIG